MPSSTSRVATEKPTPYMKQLCKHFGHKVDASFDETNGTIELPMGRCDLDASQHGVLVLAVTASDDAALERTQQVIGSHLERFGGRDELQVIWA